MNTFRVIVCDKLPPPHVTPNPDDATAIILRLCTVCDCVRRPITVHGGMHVTVSVSSVHPGTLPCILSINGLQNVSLPL